MTSSRWPSRTSWALPVAMCVPLLLGAKGGGCDVVPGGAFGEGSDGGSDQNDGAAGQDDASSTCTPASCAGLGAPAIAKVCPDGTSLGATLCEDLGGGHCGWGFPACPGDGGATTDAAVGCPPGPQCALPDCMYGVLPQTDANGCPVCSICAPPPDAGADAACDCGAPPPVAECVGGGSPPVACEKSDGGSCSWVVGSCPSGACTSDAQCPSGEACGFLETSGCAATGTCVTATQIVCNLYSPGCACDGAEITVACTGLPSGYVSEPLRHTGACVDGG
jgi:hypothetical protein